MKKVINMYEKELLAKLTPEDLEQIYRELLPLAEKMHYALEKVIDTARSRAMKPDFQKAYNIIMEYGVYLSEKDRQEIVVRLKECGL